MGGTSRDPDIALAIFCNRASLFLRQRLIGDGSKSSFMKTVESVFGSDPDIAMAIRENGTRPIIR